jgi:small GTP-binding protein
MTEAPKAVLLGDTCVGKTSIIRRLQGAEFSSEVVSTIGAAYAVIPSARGPLKIWDTAGQETFRSLTPLYYRSANLVILVFAVNLRETFAALPQWISEVKANATQPTEMIIVGNKIDLRGAPGAGDCVTSEEISEFAEGQKAGYVETSCRQGDGIDTLLHFMGSLAYKNVEEEMQATALVIDQAQGQGGKAPCAC